MAVFKKVKYVIELQVASKIKGVRVVNATKLPFSYVNILIQDSSNFGNIQL